MTKPLTPAEKKARADARKANRKVPATRKKVERKGLATTGRKAPAGIRQKPEIDKSFARIRKASAEVRQPPKNPDSKCGQVWAAADRLFKELKMVPTIQELFEVTDKAGLNRNNVRAEYVYWRRYNNLTPVWRGSAKHR